MVEGEGASFIAGAAAAGWSDGNVNARVRFVTGFPLRSVVLSVLCGEGQCVRS